MTVGVIGAKLHDVVEGVDGVGVLQLIEVADTEIIPTHPVGIVLLLGLSDGIVAQI